MKKECPSCAMEIDQTDEVCPICGYEFPQSRRLIKPVTWVLVLLLLLPFIRLVLRLLIRLIE
ncbi:zinc ribbon domain-containing protein [candidate division KSB1 bacterium]|nr:zinc ribbon domain-containing protein [candidate division KSB1 bacterium]